MCVNVNIMCLGIKNIDQLKAKLKTIYYNTGWKGFIIKNETYNMF